MSANLQVREREFRENARDAQGVSFWGGTGAFASDATLAQWMGGEKPEEPELDANARLEMRIKRGDAVAELGAGIVSQQAKIELDQRGGGTGNYSFGEPGADYDGDGVQDDKESNGYSSRRQSLISYMIDTAIADIDYQLAKNREELDLISRELDQLIPLYEKLTRDLGEKGAQVAEQKNLVANDQKTLDAAIIDADKAKIEFTAQNQVVERKQTEVTTQEGVVAQKTVEEQQAAQNLTVAKENTVVKTEEKVAAYQDVGNVANTYLEEQANNTIGYVNGEGNHVTIFKKTGPDGKEYFVGAAGDPISETDKAQLAEAYKNADGSSLSDEDLLSKTKTFDEKSHQQWIKELQSKGLVAVTKDENLQLAQKDEQKAQSVWETAADSLKTETQKLDTLKHELADEQKKLDEKEQILAEKQQKVEEAKETLANDEEKLAKLEAEYAEIAKQREEVKVKIDALKEKQAELTAENEKLKTAKAKLSDPEYQAKLKGMDPKDAAAELDKLGISAEAKAQIAAEIKNAAPEPAPTAKGATPSPTAESLVAKAGGEPITLAPSSAAKDAEPDTWPPASEASSKMAFTAAANQTTAPTTTPAAPAREEEELKNQPPTLAAPAPKASAPAAMV